LLGAVGVVLSNESPAETVDVVFTVFDDRSFGALVSFGIGGVATELLGDRAYAAAPMTTADAEELIRAPRAAPLLNGYSPAGYAPFGGGTSTGPSPSDTGALADLALRLSALGDALPELAECRLDARATPFGVHVTGVRACVAPPTARADTGPRRMRGL